MDTITNKETYINFLEAINKAQDTESIYQNTFEIIYNFFNVNRIQLWEELSESNEISVSYEYFNSKENSMLKFRLQALPDSMKKLFQQTEVWEYPDIKDEFLNKFNIKSLIGIDFSLPEQKKGILILTSKEKNKNLNDNEINFLIKLKTLLELSVYKSDKLQRNTDEIKRLHNQNKILREHEHARINFINNIAHEFKTPLSSILGFSKMLSTKNHIGDPAKEIAEQIQQAANRLSSLINNFLEVTKTTTEGWTTHYEPCDIGEIIKQSVEEFTSLNKKHKISYIISSNYPILKTDPRLIRQVLDNLISNAIKYSPNGGIIIVSLQVSINNKEIKVLVSDHGIGIGIEEIPKIFNRLYRSTNPQVQNIPGSGLGLAICKEMIAALDGKIDVKSELSKGSTFIITLPIT